MNGDDITPQESAPDEAAAGATPPSPEDTASGDSAQPAPEEAAETAAPSGPISEALRQAFSDYLDKSGARAEYGDHVNIDLDFLKNHAGPMFASMFQQLTAKIIPKDMKLEVPVKPPESQGDRNPVAVNFDLGSILGSFFSPKGSAAPSPAPAAAPEPEVQAETAPAAAAPSPSPDDEAPPSA